MARRTKIGIIGGVFAGMLGVAGIGSYNIYTSLDSDAGGSHPQRANTSASASVTAASLTRKEITDTADAFLTAWSSGRTAKAAGLTDSVQTATAAFAGYASDGHIGSVRITPGAATADGERFTVTARVAYQGLKSSWTYTSSLAVARNADSDPVVTWAPSVLHPDLADGDSLVTGLAQAPDVEVTDRNGTVLTADRYPSLARIIDDLKERYGSRITGGTPGVETYVQKADGSAGKTLNVLREGRGKRLTTTLDATVQTAAENAVAGKSEAGVTALDTRSGAILAVAYAPVSGTDRALMEDSAPGSTFKIVTAAALLEHGMKPSSPAPCRSRDSAGHGGRMYRNDTDSLQNPNASLEWDFAQSCNTGFIAQADQLGGSGLRDTAEQFGLTKEWQVGTPTPDDQPNVPGGGAPDEMTSEMIGQGQLRMSPLVMASVAATASTGKFRQPRIVAQRLIDGPPVTAGGISIQVSKDLRQMMRSTITTGTAQKVMSGFGPDSGAKTGSAEVAGQSTTNGWFTAFAGHVAAAAIVHDAGHGNTTAGPIVAAVLSAS